MPRAFLAARVPNRPEALSADLVRIVRAADPSLPLGLPRTMTAVIGDTLAPRTSRFEVVLVFAVAAAALALVGLSGALARSVQERRRELAIRAAIGATPGDLLRGVMWHGLWLSVAGVGLGLVASAAAARAASAILFGVTPYDALTYGAVAGGVLLVAATACYVPARRAASSDPLELLHAE
jgi:ABC-type antimicrobial peptide transport system permease subunit